MYGADSPYVLSLMRLLIEINTVNCVMVSQCLLWTPLSLGYVKNTYFSFIQWLFSRCGKINPCHIYLKKKLGIAWFTTNEILIHFFMYEYNFCYIYTRCYILRPRAIWCLKQSTDISPISKLAIEVCLAIVMDGFESKKRRLWVHVSGVLPSHRGPTDVEDDRPPHPKMARAVSASGLYDSIVTVHAVKCWLFAREPTYKVRMNSWGCCFYGK